MVLAKIVASMLKNRAELHDCLDVGQGIILRRNHGLIAGTADPSHVVSAFTCKILLQTRFYLSVC
jgi:hypothetical protein